MRAMSLVVDDSAHAASASSNNLTDFEQSELRSLKTQIALTNDMIAQLTQQFQDIRGQVRMFA